MGESTLAHAKLAAPGGIIPAMTDDPKWTLLGDSAQGSIVNGEIVAVVYTENIGPSGSVVTLTSFGGCL